MDLAEYLPMALKALDAVPESRLAISLDNLNRSEDAHLIGLDLVKSFARAADTNALTEEQKADLALFRKCQDIAAGRIRLGEEVTYPNMRRNFYDLGGSLSDLVTDSEALALVKRVIEAEPVLRWLVADRYQQQIRKRTPGYRGGPELDDHIVDIERTLDADPDGRLAVSLRKLLHSGDVDSGVIDVVKTYVLSPDVAESQDGQLADDILRLQRAFEINMGWIELGGMTLDNLAANVRGMMGELSNFVTAAEARGILNRIIAAVPSLARDIAALPPATAF